MEDKLETEIRELERQIEELRASAPAHDTTGAHDRQLLVLEDELDDKRNALARQRGEPPTAT
ncbi:MAG: hypothetical protein ACODAJ_14675 [Planctomycetota bacterium]